MVIEIAERRRLAWHGVRLASKSKTRPPKMTRTIKNRFLLLSSDDDNVISNVEGTINA